MLMSTQVLKELEYDNINCKVRRKMRQGDGSHYYLRPCLKMVLLCAGRGQAGGKKNRIRRGKADVVEMETISGIFIRAGRNG